MEGEFGLAPSTEYCGFPMTMKKANANLLDDLL